MVRKIRRGNKVNAGERVIGAYYGPDLEVTHLLVERPRKSRKRPGCGKTLVIRVPEGCLEQVKAVVKAYRESCQI